MKGWIQASRTIISDTTYDVPGLTKGASYEFRVSAENGVGMGEPSEASSVAKCEKKIGKRFTAL